MKYLICGNDNAERLVGGVIAEESIGMFGIVAITSRDKGDQLLINRFSECYRLPFTRVRGQATGNSGSC